MRELLIEIEKCLGCKSCELACGVIKSSAKNIFGAAFEAPKPVPRVFVETGNGINLPMQCRQCEDAKCVLACMSGAMSKDASGLIANDPDKCVGCWMCVMVCPFGAITRDHNQQAIKCDRCNEDDYPACVRACPTKAIKYEDITVYSKAGRKKFLTNIKGKEEV